MPGREPALRCAVSALAGLAFIYPLWGWRRLQATTIYLREELERFRDSPDDTLDGLPDATLLIETGGNVRLLNAEARPLRGDDVPGQRFGVALASLPADKSDDFAAAAPTDPALPSELSDGVGRISACPGRPCAPPMTSCCAGCCGWPISPNCALSRASARRRCSS